MIRLFDWLIRKVISETPEKPHAAVLILCPDLDTAASVTAWLDSWGVDLYNKKLRLILAEHNLPQGGKIKAEIDHTTYTITLSEKES